MYVFRKEDATGFADRIGIKYKTNNDEITFNKCPYCGNTTDDKNTFGISLKTGQFHCFRSSCNASGNMITLAKDFNFQLSNYREDVEPIRRYRKLPQKDIETKQNAIDFMKTRGISEEITKRYHLTIRDDNADAVVFPFYNDKGEMEFVKYRNTAYVKGRGAKEWCEVDTKPILFGMDQCDFEDKTLIMTEGQIDSLSLNECGYKNAVSVPTGQSGFTWKEHCYDFLLKFDKLIVFGDCENGHITLLDKMKEIFEGSVYHVREQDYKGCKDANELMQKHGKDAVHNAIKNAQMVESPLVMQMADVKRTARDIKDRTSTGFKSIDSCIDGFYKGQLIILTGERGKGKSTFGSQLCIHAVGQNRKTLMYSGEMSDWQVKGWLDRQIAGRHNINTINRPDGFTSYSVKAETTPTINEWIRDRLYIMNTDVIDDTKPFEGQIKRIIKQYGFEYVFLDNLMTALSDDLRSDLYRQQSNLVKALVKIARECNCVIVLVVHPRKSGKEGFSNDDVMGSSNITNLAHVVLRYDIPDIPKKEKDAEGEWKKRRVVQILKNRDIGKLAINGFELYYDEQSKRIVDIAADFHVDTFERYPRVTEEPEQRLSIDELFDSVGIDSDELPF